MSLSRLGSILCVLAVAVAAQAGPPLSVSLTLLTDGLTRPVAVRHANDGSNRIFIVEQPGTIRVYDGVLVTAPVLDIQDKVLRGTDGGNEQGFLGLAFHPDFSTNALFYVNYVGLGGETRIERYQMMGGDSSVNVADPASALEVITIDQDFSNHNGGDLHFGPDGYLYIGMGDGGLGQDPCDRSQQLTPNQQVTGACSTERSAALLGKMLRLDVDGVRESWIFTDGFGDFIAANEACGSRPDGSAAYAIPQDNPFVATPDTCDEIWSYGLRNPFRFSFDRLRGDLFIGDVGQDAVEEINFEAASSSGGVNFGWSCREGDIQQEYNPCLPTSLIDPILSYLHADGGCSITGGYRYRGPEAALQGLYIYTDFCHGRLLIGREIAAGVWRLEADIASGITFSLSGFGEDEAGNLYVTDLNGGAVHLIQSP